MQLLSNASLPCRVQPSLYGVTGFSLNTDPTNRDWVNYNKMMWSISSNLLRDFSPTSSRGDGSSPEHSSGDVTPSSVTPSSIVESSITPSSSSSSTRRSSKWKQGPGRVDWIRSVVKILCHHSFEIELNNPQVCRF